MKKKHSNVGQASLEFIILFLFALVIISLALYFIGFLSIGFSKQEAMLYREDIANTILEEFDLYDKVEIGYKREFQIPSFIMENYNISLNKTSRVMTINDFLVDDGEISYFYDLPMRVNFNSSIDIEGNLIITLNKNLSQNLEKVLII